MALGGVGVCMQRCIVEPLLLVQVHTRLPIGFYVRHLCITNAESFQTKSRSRPLAADKTSSGPSRPGGKHERACTEPGQTERGFGLGPGLFQRPFYYSSAFRLQSTALIQAVKRSCEQNRISRGTIRRRLDRYSPTGR
jgi:hypothetical protein